MQRRSTYSFSSKLRSTGKDSILKHNSKQTLCISVDEQFDDSDVDDEFLEI